MNEIINEIQRLKKEKNAVILAHNYEIGEIQDIADFVGDSLGLSQQAAKTNAELIVFCGVHFMAETASIISPNKKVLIPDLQAGCSLASTINAEQLRNWKEEHPGSIVISYINTTAEVKAESDYCCTSSNAVKIVESVPKDKKILFLPDKFLGQYVKAINFDDARAIHPNAEFLIHPECGCSSSCMLKSQVYFDCKNVHIFSTEGMIRYVEQSPSNEFVIATEVGILHRLKKLKPQAEFYPVSDKSICEYMKMITVEKLYESLRDNKYEVKVPEEIASKARIPIERMLEIV
jgi:quinolinate synthase